MGFAGTDADDGDCADVLDFRRHCWSNAMNLRKDC